MFTTEATREGRFITFEGTDGSGKTTQMRLLAERLRNAGFTVAETQEPGGTEIGRRIRGILLDPASHRICPIAEMLLYFAARAQNFDELILPEWKGGAIVLSDRFTDSTLAYQGDGRGLGPDVVVQLHDIACHGIQPDLTIYVDIDLETGLERARTTSGDRLDNEAAEFHQRVRESYLKLAVEHAHRFRTIDGRGTISEVSERVWDAVVPALPHAAVIPR
ncbi:MAG: dTMP kinase [Bryobacteraceae bacterium]|nr:dTMP kinase [Bryobacteraceae bacterium]